MSQNNIKTMTVMEPATDVTKHDTILLDWFAKKKFVTSTNKINYNYKIKKMNLAHFFGCKTRFDRSCALLTFVLFVIAPILYVSVDLKNLDIDTACEGHIARLHTCPYEFAVSFATLYLDEIGLVRGNAAIGQNHTGSTCDLWFYGEHEASNIDPNQTNVSVVTFGTMDSRQNPISNCQLYDAWCHCDEISRINTEYAVPFSYHSNQTLIDNFRSCLKTTYTRVSL